ncbi:MAG: ABC transporter ATP-binding protein [Bacilli bacterium]
MSVIINITNAKKVYDNKTIIDNLSLNIKAGELFTLLGPSGCGKTTLLRMIAGFNAIDGGSFEFNDLKINDLAPEKRNIGLVFQNYAIFPHLSVKKNVAFGLGNRKLSKDEINTRVARILKVMQIEEYQDRMPDKLSGGQQQRVALARAIVIEPDVLLMDEPLSNLDAKLRVDMRSAIRDIQKKVNITTVYVTHDQEEAMAISDRIAVMNDGCIQQLATPQNIYQRPANIFVATFVGKSNIIDAKLFLKDHKNYLLFSNTTFLITNLIKEEDEQTVKVSIRPEEFKINKTGLIEGYIINKVFLGVNTHYNIQLQDQSMIEVINESNIDDHYLIGDLIKLDLVLNKINIFSSDGLKNLIQGVHHEG